VPLFDSGSEKGLLWYAMPYVEGETLRNLLGRLRQLPFHDAVRFTAELAEALDVAHHAGIVHRDLKPENVLLSGGHALLADFGIARLFRESQASTLTSPGVSLGTPNYMSPEQILGDAPAVGPPSDQYALACLLYEMLVGQPPFAGRTSEVVQQHLSSKPPRASALRPGLPRTLDGVIAKGMAKTPADRYSSCGELAAAARAAATR
jgi:serine/threonine protein kinase